VRVFTNDLYLYIRGYWQEGDVKLTQAWLTDLKSVGYVPPKVRPVYQPGLVPSIPETEKIPSSHHNQKINDPCNNGQSSQGNKQTQRTEPVRVVTVMLPFKDDPNGDRVIKHIRSVMGSASRNLPGRNVTVYHKGMAYPQVVEIQNLENVELIDIDALTTQANPFPAIWEHAAKTYQNFLYVYSFLIHSLTIIIMILSDSLAMKCESHRLY
jgi:hypothetical protein